MLVVILPMSAAVKLSYQQWMEHREAADRLDRLREHGERSWREALKDHNASTVEQDSRALQDEIFDGRKRNPLVFDLVFKRLRADQEAQMNFGRGIRHGGRTSTSRKGRPASSVLTNRSSDCSGDVWPRQLASTKGRPDLWVGGEVGAVLCCTSWDTVSRCTEDTWRVRSKFRTPVGHGGPQRQTG